MTRRELAKKGLKPEIVYGRHPDSTIIVVGNSASLNELDLDLLGKFLTIGVNRILRVFEPSYVFIVDKSVIKDEHLRMKAVEDRIPLIIYPGAMSSVVRSKWFDGAWISTGPMSGTCDPAAKKGAIHICRGGNSGYEAAQLAYRMGAKNIALAGMDMYWPPGKDSHFFGSGKKAGCRLPKPEWKVEDFGKLKDLYKQNGVNLFSVSTWDTPFRRRVGYIPLEQLEVANGC